MVVWISLLIRKALLLIAIVFAPIALAGSSWDHTRTWVSRWASFVIAMILSKVVLVVIFLLATAQVSAPIDADLQSVSQPIAGVVLMLMAGFAPYLTYKAISFMGFDMYHAMSAEQEAKSSLNRPMPIPLARRGGSAEPAKILGDAAVGRWRWRCAGGRRPPPAPSGGGAPPTAEGGGAAHRRRRRRRCGRGGRCSRRGAVVAQDAAAAGPRLGGFVAAQAIEQAGRATSPQRPRPSRRRWRTRPCADLPDGGRRR